MICVHEKEIAFAFEASCISDIQTIYKPRPWMRMLVSTSKGDADECKTHEETSVDIGGSTARGRCTAGVARGL